MNIKLACCIATALGCASFGASAQQISDILWRNTTTGENVVWKGGDHLQTLPVRRVNLDWQVAGVSFSGFNGAATVIWRNRKDGRNVAWPSGSADAAFNFPTVPGKSWKLAGTGYFYASTELYDLVWRDSATGRNVMWRVGSGRYGGTMATVTPEWKIAGIGDFDGDGYSDLLWRNQVTGANVFWSRADSHAPRAMTSVANVAWQVAAIVDFDGDRIADILWRNANTGANAVWFRGLSTKAMAFPSVAPSWHVVGVGDFDGNYTPDVLWRDTATGRNAFWPSGNPATPIELARVPNQAWIVAGVGNFHRNPWEF